MSMNLLKRTTLFNKLFKNTPFKPIIFGIFILLHLFLLNINSAEWGDSYRILRGGENIRRLTYETKEKRPPLVSAVIALRPTNLDAVMWGRVVMLMFSLLTFVVFDKLSSLYIKDKKYQLISLLFFALNPVYLYWSIRIMADVPFSLFVLLAFYLLEKWKDNLDTKKLVLLGLVCGLSILTRFEGYLLTFSILMGVTLLNKEFSIKVFKVKTLFNMIRLNFKKLLILGLTTLVLILPWLLFRSPLESKYFNEPESRVYNLNTIWIYFVSLFYLLGFTQFFYFIFINPADFIKFFKQNLGIAVFTILELILILVWPAAIPRLFISIIPFLIITFVLQLEKYYTNNQKVRSSDVIVAVFLLILYGFSQYILKLQFLVASRNLFLCVFAIQIVLTCLLLCNKKKAFLVVTILSMFVWSLSVIYLHKDLYHSIKDASEYVALNLSGRVAYDNVNGVTDWYLNRSGINKDVSGFYYPVMVKKDLDFKRIADKDVDYMLLTNEHNPDASFDIDKRPYLTLVKDFRYNVNGKDFFTLVIKFNKDFYNK
jgi:4-amino-4-deoxy-L-arabinose transferase-like glycosyltransferase